MKDSGKCLQAAVALKHSQLAAVASSIARLRSSSLAAACSAWRHACASKQRKRQQLAQASAWFRSGSLKAAFVAWQDAAQDQQQAASRLLQAVTFFQSHRQLAAWNTWLEVRRNALLGNHHDNQRQGRGGWHNSHAQQTAFTRVPG